MKYISIDLETTGLDPENCQILTIGAVIEDTNNIKPMEELPTFHAAILHRRIEGSPFAINMNKEIIESIVYYQTAEDDSEQFDQIITDNSFLPLWMRTQQEVGAPSEEYVFALPLAYCKPGTGNFVKDNIDNYINSTNFNFNQIDYEIDRYIIDSTLNNSNEQYILFSNYKYNV